MHWVHNLAVSKTTPLMLLDDPYRTYFIFGAVNLAGAVAAYWLPETKGVSVIVFCFLTTLFWRICASPENRD